MTYPSARSAMGIIAAHSGKTLFDLSAELRLAEDLGLDSLDRAALAVEIEAACGVDLDQDAPERWITCGDVAATMRAARDAPQELDLAKTRFGATILANKAKGSVSILLSFPGRYAMAASLPVAAVGLSFDEKKQLAENIALRLNASCMRGS
jgi:acyl carrier protein